MSKSVMDEHSLPCSDLTSDYLEIKEFGDLVCTCTSGKMFTDFSRSNFAADGSTVSQLLLVLVIILSLD